MHWQENRYAYNNSFFDRDTIDSGNDPPNEEMESFRAPDRELNRKNNATTKKQARKLAKKFDKSLLTPKEIGKIRIATWNLNGKLKTQKGQLVEDLKRRRIDIACLQETHYKNETEYYEEHYVDRSCIITIEPEEMFNLRQQASNKRTSGHPAGKDKDIHYGIGFYISPRMEERHIGCKVYSNRLAASFYQMGKTDRNFVLAVINAYAPQSGRAWRTENREDGDEQVQTSIIDDFYAHLERAVQDVKKISNMYIIAGDFNAIVGKPQSQDEEHSGKYGLGRRNRSGAVLAEFARERKLLFANTFFKHRSSHKLTWEGNIKKKPDETAMK